MIAQLNKEYICSKPSKVVPRLLAYFFYEGRPATTRGQWFNPITFKSLKSASRTKLIPCAESPIFIIGTGRSGSTILGLVLSMHPDIGFLNEPKALWYFVNPQDDLIGSYSMASAKYLMNKGDASPSIIQSAKAIYSSYLKKSSSQRVLDKFPEMIFRLEYLNTIFQNPKYIFLFRNPWSTIASTAAWSENHTNEQLHEDWWGVNNRKWNLLVDQVVIQDPHLGKYVDEIKKFTKQIDKSAVEWIVTMNKGLKMKKLFPERIFQLRYEDLATNPENYLNKICEFANLTKSELLISFGKKTIHPAATPPKISINPLLNDAIADLSTQLGYSHHSPSMSVTE